MLRKGHWDEAISHENNAASFPMYSYEDKYKIFLTIKAEMLPCNLRN